MRVVCVLSLSTLFHIVQGSSSCTYAFLDSLAQSFLSHIGFGCSRSLSWLWSWLSGELSAYWLPGGFQPVRVISSTVEDSPSSKLRCRFLVAVSVTVSFLWEEVVGLLPNPQTWRARINIGGSLLDRLPCWANGSGLPMVLKSEFPSPRWTAFLGLRVLSTRADSILESPSPSRVAKYLRATSALLEMLPEGLLCPTSKPLTRYGSSALSAVPYFVH